LVIERAAALSRGPFSFASELIGPDQNAHQFDEDAHEYDISVDGKD
jgi:hypothetical protein